ncbi:MAG: anhydro-N-acetylmuramic acid kinase [Planctomycetota bacterium]|nr:anhydro-N-acetylmuramic acid kinase [Planctomycetota bacterium]
MDQAALRDKLNGPEGLVVAGLLSGTSADGIDVGLARFRWDDPKTPGCSPELLAFETVPFAPELNGRLRRALDGGGVDLGGVALLHRDLGRAFGEAAAAVAVDLDLRLDWVGSHGQTVWHFDGAGAPGTLQLGDGAQVAAACGAPVVNDFRAAHVAAGGHGAPLAILADARIFAGLARPTAILNLGGMANLSWLGSGSDPARAFDTGPAGSLLDGLARRLLGEPMDRDGLVALGGKPRPEWVDFLLRSPFFEAEPPKSTGRDTFGPLYVSGFLERVGERAPVEHVLASATRAVARSVGQAMERWLPQGASQLWVAGGGVHNRALMADLGAETGLDVRSSAEMGVSPDAREALLFACLAVDFLQGRGPAVGAESRVVLGKLCLPPG